MNQEHRVNHVHVGQYVAEVDVDLLEDETDWRVALAVTSGAARETLSPQLRHLLKMCRWVAQSMNRKSAMQ